jgi:cell division protein ZapA (FtsZ GTPase activity inhibitor)
MDKKSIEVVLGGHRLTLRTDADPVHVRNTAEYVNKKIREVNPENQILSTQMLLLVAMNMADESLREQNENRQFREKIRSKSEFIFTRLEQEFALGAE